MRYFLNSLNSFRCLRFSFFNRFLAVGVKVCVLSSLCADVHSEAVQAALAKHKEEKMALPMPTKRRSTYVQSPIEARTPPGKIQGSCTPTLKTEDEFLKWSVPFCFSRLVLRFWRWDVRTQTVFSCRPPTSGQHQLAEPGLLDQPLRPGLLYVLLCLVHAVARGSQASEPAAASVQAAVPTSVPASGAEPHRSRRRHAGSQSHRWDGVFWKHLCTPSVVFCL